MLNSFFLLPSCSQTVSETSSEPEPEVAEIWKDIKIDQAAMKKYAESLSWDQLIQDSSAQALIAQVDAIVQVDEMIENFQEKEVTFSKEQKVKIYYIGAQYMLEGIQRIKKWADSLGVEGVAGRMKRELVLRRNEAMRSDITQYVMTDAQRQ